MIHYKACAKTRKEKLADIALMVFGFVAAVYTTVQTIRVRPFSILHLIRNDQSLNLADGGARRWSCAKVREMSCPSSL
jgi:hypothetical protein